MTGTPSTKRHPPAVYRRRRLVVLLALLAVVAVVWLLIAQPWNGWATESGASESQDAATELPVPASSEAEGATTPPADGAATAAPSESPTAKACVANDITVDPVTDVESYASGQNPQLSIRLTNEGETDCSLNVGTSGQVFTITSGSDTWWRSTDCQTEPSDQVVMLAAGQTVTSAAPLTWDRTRSSVDTCDDPNRQPAPAGGAAYHVTVEIGGVASTSSALFLLY